MTKEEWWPVRVHVLHSILQGIAVQVALGTHNLASPQHIQRSSRLLVQGPILMLMMIPLVLPLAPVETTWSLSVLTISNLFILSTARYTTTI